MSLVYSSCSVRDILVAAGALAGHMSSALNARIRVHQSVDCAATPPAKGSPDRLCVWKWHQIELPRTLLSVEEVAGKTVLFASSDLLFFRGHFFPWTS
jgi:hypothetical protein